MMRKVSRYAYVIRKDFVIYYCNIGRSHMPLWSEIVIRVFCMFLLLVVTASSSRYCIVTRTGALVIVWHIAWYWFWDRNVELNKIVDLLVLNLDGYSHSLNSRCEVWVRIRELGVLQFVLGTNWACYSSYWILYYLGVLHFVLSIVLFGRVTVRIEYCINWACYSSYLVLY